MAYRSPKTSLPRGPCDRKKSIPIENINPDRKFQSRLKISIPDLQNSPQKIGDWRVARLKISIPLEIFNPGGRS